MWQTLLIRVEEAMSSRESMASTTVVRTVVSTKLVTNGRNSSRLSVTKMFLGPGSRSELRWQMVTLISVAVVVLR